MLRVAFIVLLLSTVTANAEMEWVECGDWSPSAPVHHFAHPEWVHHSNFYRPHMTHHHVYRVGHDGKVKRHCRHLHRAKLCLREVSLSGGGGSFGDFTYPEGYSGDDWRFPSFGFPETGSGGFFFRRHHKHELPLVISTEPVVPITPIIPGSPISPIFPIIPVSPTTPIPEPSTYAMMILGFLGLGWVGRKRINKNVGLVR